MSVLTQGRVNQRRSGTICLSPWTERVAWGSQLQCTNLNTQHVTQNQSRTVESNLASMHLLTSALNI
jgi:hypothetical protein